MGIPTATAALKTMWTNVVAGGLMPAPQLDSDYLGLDETAVEKLQAQFVREFALWANRKAACDATGVNNFYAMQQLARAVQLAAQADEADEADESGSAQNSICSPR